MVRSCSKTKTETKPQHPFNGRCITRRLRRCPFSQWNALDYLRHVQRNLHLRHFLFLSGSPKSKSSRWQVEASIKESQRKHHRTNGSEGDGESEGLKRGLNFPMSRNSSATTRATFTVLSATNPQGPWASLGRRAQSTDTTMHAIGHETCPIARDRDAQSG